jgi:hypothetical protein
MIMRKSNKKDGEPLTLNGLMSELNNLFASRKDDPKAMDIKSMIQSLVNGEACFEEEDEQPELITTEDGTVGIDISNEDLSGGMVGYDRFMDALKAEPQIFVNDELGDKIPAIAFISTENMMEGVVDTIRAMKKPMIVASETTEGGIDIIKKAFVACGEMRERLINKYGFINGFVFDEQSGGMCRMSINRKDGYDFIIGENKTTRFIIFDETVCPATIPADIIADDRKWGKRMTSEIPKLIEKTIEEFKTNEKKLPFADAVQPALTKIDIPNLTDKKTAMCNLPETCTFEETPYANIKKPLIADIMKDFADAKCSGKVGKDTFVEFMKPENKEAVATAVATSIAERHNPSEDVIEKDAVTKAVESAIFEEEEDDFSEEDTNPDCFRCIAEYMAKEGVDSVHFYTDMDGLIHCDVQIKTIYKVELEDSDKK